MSKGSSRLQQLAQGHIPKSKVLSPGIETVLRLTGSSAFALREHFKFMIPPSHTSNDRAKSLPPTMIVPLGRVDHGNGQQRFSEQTRLQTLYSLVHFDNCDCAHPKGAPIAGHLRTIRKRVKNYQKSRNDWRRGRDSNPRYACAYFAFRVRRDRPLCHLSACLKACGRPR